MRSLNRGSFRASPTHKFKLDRALVCVNQKNEEELQAFGKADLFERMKNISYQFITGMLMASPLFAFTTGFALNREILEYTSSFFENRLREQELN